MKHGPQIFRIALYFMAFGVLALLLVMETRPGIEQRPNGVQVIERGDMKYILDREYEVCHVIYNNGAAGLVSYRDCLPMLLRSAAKEMQSEEP